MSSGPKNVTSTTSSEPPAFLVPHLQNAATAVGSRYASDVGNPVANSLVPQGRQLIYDTLQGDCLSPDTNPYLQQTFNRAADLTRGRLSTEFAGAGRDIAASRPARSDELQTLASNIFGQNFQAERDRQTNALTSAQDFDPINQYINRLAGIIPGAGGTTTSTQPVFRTGLF